MRDGDETALTTPARTTTEYGELKRIITQQGLLRPQTTYYVAKTIVAIATPAAAVAFALTGPGTLLLLLDAVFLAFAGTQMALLAHDVGHRQTFRGRRMNALGRTLFGNLLLGVSHSWWNTKHNQHHATPNHVEKDPDVIFPMIVFSAEQIASKPRVLRPIIAYQAFFFVLLLPLQAAAMHSTSVRHLMAGRVPGRRLQATVMAFRFALYGALLYALGSWEMALAFGAVHYATFGLYNSSVFATNHKGMMTLNEQTRMDFLREQVLTSRNVRGHWLTDFWYGGLNYQIEHHLFPTMPRNRLAQAQPIVRAFCEERGISYSETGLLASYREGFAHLHAVSASLRARAAAPVTA